MQPMYQFRTANPATPFPALEHGRLAVNTSNRQLAVGDDASTATNLLAVRFFDVRARYATDEMVVQSGKVYRALAAISPGAFNGAQWEQMAPAPPAPPPPGIPSPLVAVSDDAHHTLILQSKVANASIANTIEFRNAANTQTGMIWTTGDVNDALRVQSSGDIGISPGYTGQAPVTDPRFILRVGTPGIRVSAGTNASSDGTGGVTGAIVNLGGAFHYKEDWAGDFFIGMRSFNIQAPLLLFQGDSLTYGQLGGATPYPDMVTPPNWLGGTDQTFQKHNTSIGGQGATDLINNNWRDVNPFFRVYSGKNIEIVWIGTNNLAGGNTVEQTFSYIKAYCQHQRRLGFEVGTATIISREPGPYFTDAKKNQLNALIYANWMDYADFFCDYASDPNLGAANAYDNPTYYWDKTHLTTAGYQLVANICDAAVDEYINNKAKYSGRSTIYANSGYALWVGKPPQGGPAPAPILVVDTANEQVAVHSPTQWQPLLLSSPTDLGCGIKMTSNAGAGFTFLVTGAGFSTGAGKWSLWDNSAGERFAVAADGQVQIATRARFASYANSPTEGEISFNGSAWRTMVGGVVRTFTLT